MVYSMLFCIFAEKQRILEIESMKLRILYQDSAKNEKISGFRGESDIVSRFRKSKML